MSIKFSISIQLNFPFLIFKRKVHLDGADVSEEGAADISGWQAKGDLVPAKIRSFGQRKLIHKNFNGRPLIRLVHCSGATVLHVRKQAAEGSLDGTTTKERCKPAS